MITITTPADLFPESVAFMETHGCIIQQRDTHCTVTFPQGTTCEEIYPRTPGGARFKLVLPDGCLMRQLWVRYLEQSVLYHPRYCTQTDSTQTEATMSEPVELS